MLLAGTDDGSVHFWHTSTARLALTLRLFPPKNPRDLPVDWIAYTPEGYYVGSPKVSPFIRWRVGEKLFRGQAFARRYNRPEMIRKALRPDQ